MAGEESAVVREAALDNMVEVSAKESVLSRVAPVEQFDFVLAVGNRQQVAVRCDRHGQDESQKRIGVLCLIAGRRGFRPAPVFRREPRLEHESFGEIPNRDVSRLCPCDEPTTVRCGGPRRVLELGSQRGSGLSMLPIQ